MDRGPQSPGHLTAAQAMLVRAERPKCRNSLLEVVDGLVIAEREHHDTSGSALDAPEPSQFTIGGAAPGVKCVGLDPHKNALLAAVPLKLRR